MPYVKLVLKGIEKKEPIPKGTIPLIDTVVKTLVELQKLEEHTWFNYVITIMLIFAWAFCLRCSEYTRNSIWNGPLVENIKFTKSKQGCKVLSYYLDRRKNKVHDEVEPISIPCTCQDFKLCGYCAIKNYFKNRAKQNIKSKYLFAYYENGRYYSISAFRFRECLKKLLKTYYGYRFNRKIHRAHGLRYGGITNYGTVGIPLEWIRKISGHAPQSKVLEHYLKVSSKDNAGLISQKMKQNKKSKFKI